MNHSSSSSTPFQNTLFVVSSGNWSEKEFQSVKGQQLIFQGEPTSVFLHIQGNATILHSEAWRWTKELGKDVQFSYSDQGREEPDLCFLDSEGRWIIRGDLDGIIRGDLDELCHEDTAVQRTQARVGIRKGKRSLKIKSLADLFHNHPSYNARTVGRTRISYFKI